MHVGCAADDLDGFLAADVHHADVQVIGIGMIHTGNNMADNDLVKLLAGLVHAFNGGAGHDHFGSIFFSAHGNLNVFLEPFHRYLH